MSTKDVIHHKRHTETPLLRASIEHLTNFIVSTPASYDDSWHPSDIWLLSFTIVNVFIGLLGLAYQHQTIIAILSKKPLTKG